MATMQEEMTMPRDVRRESIVSEAQYEQWVHWPVNWSAIWVGALGALAAVLIFGLIGIAIGVHVVQPESRIVDLHKIALGTLIFSVCGAFFAFVIGGWIAGKIAGILRAEPAMLHGAIVWLLATPALVVLAALGAGSYIGTWHASLAGTPTWGSRSALPFERPDALVTNATEAERAAHVNEMAAYKAHVKQWNEETPKAVRNSALGAITALLLGLVGSVIGGWLACGEPMSVTHFRTRKSLLVHRA
jgi:hypothetical protein